MLLHVYWYGTENFRAFTMVRGELSQLARFDAFPLRSSVLPPDFHLNFTEMQRASDLRTFDQGEILLLLELGFQFDQLFVGEGRALSTRRGSVRAFILRRDRGRVIFIAVTGRQTMRQ